MDQDIKTVIQYPVGATEFDIPFDYLSRKFVRVSLVADDNRRLLSNITEYRYVSKTRVKLLVETTGFDRVEIRRFTSASERIVDFNDGSVLRAADLNVSQIQSAHIAEEARDAALMAMSEDDAGNLDARNRKIVRLAPGESGTDAINKNQLDETLGEAGGILSDFEDVRDEIIQYISKFTDDTGAVRGVSYVYNNGRALGGETGFHIDITPPPLGVPYLSINGSKQYRGYHFTYDPITGNVQGLATPLEKDDFVVATTTESVIPIEDLYASTQGASMIGTLSGSTVEERYMLDKLNQPKGSTIGVLRDGRTIQEAIDDTVALPHVSPMWQKVRSAMDDVYIVIMGDSTGNETFEWVYQWATHLSQTVKTHSIRYRLWVDGSGWQGEERMSTGTTERSIFIDNVSVPGSTERYFQGSATSNIFNSGRVYDLVLLNYGHNEGTSVPSITISAGFTEAIFACRQINPMAPIIVTAQNPRRDFPDHSARAVACWADIAGVNGLGVIDVYSAFIKLGSPSELYIDMIHPNAEGHKVWLEVVKKALSDTPSYQFDKVAEPYSGPLRMNLIPNPAFVTWGVNVPALWEANAVDVTRDLARRESFAYSVKVTCTDVNSPLLYVDLSDTLTASRGQWVTFAARVWRPSGISTNAGRLQIRGSGMNTVTSRSKANEAENGWMWAVCHAFVPKGTTSLQARFLGGTVVGDSFNVDRVWFGIGKVPSDIDFMGQPAVTLADYYQAENVGVPVGYDTQVSVDGNHIVATPVASKARFFININYLTPGQTYRVTWSKASPADGYAYARSSGGGLGAVLDTVRLSAGTTSTFRAPSKTCSFVMESDGINPLDVTIASIVKV
ncbi:hypothetical protein [Klebsiella phage vB_KoxP_ZX8]|uniref:Probable tail spike protein n=2 Tax=root TaxID=1 RepID=A0AAE7SNR9_9CAUD|nr:hypothetical protein [Klebsiella phage vB_KoxP_ZX8]